ncbi:F-box protein At2g14500 [Eutrema salsugineum]|nr:F-box protein At2g14500 [Eutrema salsugineum]
MVLKRSSSLPDFRHVKALRSNSNLTVPGKSGSPLLTLFLDDGRCELYNPIEGKTEKMLGDFSGSRFLASCGKWFLMLDSRSRLYIIDVFSKDRIGLPPLESVVSDLCSLKRVGDRDKEFTWELTDGTVFNAFADEIRASLWVDEKAEELALVWFFDAPAGFLCCYKKGNDHYNLIPVGQFGIPKMLTGLHGLVLRGYRLYILTTRNFVRVIDFSGKKGFEELTDSDPSPTFSPLGYSCNFSIAVTTAGEVLLVTNTVFERSERTFHVYKKDPNADPDDYMPDLLEVHSLGDEALLLDLGITVPANPTLGIKPNSIYFTRHYLIRYGTSDRSRVLPPYEVDICVFNLATKTLEPFPAPPNMNLKDARWIFSLT